MFGEEPNQKLENSKQHFLAIDNDWLKFMFETLPQKNRTLEIVSFDSREK